MNNEEQKQRDLEMVREHAFKLSEHFDAVQILVNRHESGTLDGTMAVNLGSGNWHSRYGQVVEWIVKSDARSSAEAISPEDEK